IFVTQNYCKAVGRRAPLSVEGSVESAVLAVDSRVWPKSEEAKAKNVRRKTNRPETVDGKTPRSCTSEAKQERVSTAGEKEKPDGVGSVLENRHCLAVSVPFSVP
uniref:Uncharacterized protein n=1 Tax=Anopheles atroparvus TaxID=41427 RepID=A0AAG5CPA3_ANOAO